MSCPTGPALAAFAGIAVTGGLVAWHLARRRRRSNDTVAMTQSALILGKRLGASSVARTIHINVFDAGTVHTVMCAKDGHEVCTHDDARDFERGCELG